MLESKQSGKLPAWRMVLFEAAFAVTGQHWSHFINSLRFYCSTYFYLFFSEVIFFFVLRRLHSFKFIFFLNFYAGSIAWNKKWKLWSFFYRYSNLSSMLVPPICLSLASWNRRMCGSLLLSTQHCRWLNNSGHGLLKWCFFFCFMYHVFLVVKYF